jgi:hypothetical protein
MEILNEPARVWHVLALFFLICFAWHSLQKQIGAVGKCVVDMWEKFLPYKHDDRPADREDRNEPEGTTGRTSCRSGRLYRQAQGGGSQGMRPALWDDVSTIAV